jgi:hypothetical protein
MFTDGYSVFWLEILESFVRVVKKVSLELSGGLNDNDIVFIHTSMAEYNKTQCHHIIKYIKYSSQSPVTSDK